MALVRFFAAAAEAAGVAEQPVDAETLGELRATLSAEHAGLAPLLGCCAVLVDGARASDDTVLPATATVDVLPPFAGG
ncbi:MoaD/ThiS family protein [Mycolicibacterium brumae]|uniref:Molybdopterin synthase sulfur carrier subunit n=1 Tax=Mycolicibacterium brumae TaxID=85968 RepID=A0A2G5PDT6_9MYCO|nr:MoaD/ThiS family protein [Mycolicibacterium brumae]MCV7193488.1 MoaD/ThiS family protein [Mycolicibacterium brumae]PIB76074.1 molybdopterin synthase sulfur carrier subunit [Mycolicibacterium brumae]RWA17187.1 hypothetical protein MBRU_06065 [Mycolicibacterium brumae DSM 44177]UWW09239.1 MoaD/ThiS family protein [Mycolicibacterium brumae]